MKHPSPADIDELASALDLRLDEQEVSDLADIVATTLDTLGDVDVPTGARLPPAEYGYTDRAPGYQPDHEEDPYNAWITKCRVQGAESGPLSGLTVGLKDTINLAGVRLTLNSPLMEGFVPRTDATVVKRLLDGGATVIGKNTMVGLGTRFGIPRNPVAPEYSIGGSTAGGAAAVAAGDADIAIGGDQAGSIRLPAAYGGIVGLKPTHGLLPYTGIVGHDRAIDHTGPLARTVETAALATETMAGPDGLDSRQPPSAGEQSYADALVDDVSGMTIAVLDEGFSTDVSEDDVNDVVWAAIDDLEDMGANIEQASVPSHLETPAIVHAILIYGQAQTMLHNGIATGASGWHDVDFAAFMGRARRSMSRDLPTTSKAKVLLAAFVRRHYHGTLYGEAHNAAVALRAKYDDILETADAIALPTSPKKPNQFGQRRDVPAMKAQGITHQQTANTGIFNVTHHPAISVPCGTTAGAPVGLMFVGDHFDESTLFRLAHTYEQRTEHGLAA